jgi:predicted  nucleic acid-binding Zn-ribbon protein
MIEALQAENERLDKENTDSLVILATAIQHRDGFRKQLNDLRHEMDDLEGQYSDLQEKYNGLQSDIEGAYGFSANP